LSYKSGSTTFFSMAEGNQTLIFMRYKSLC